jgi:predicted RNA-binding protein with PIN domain
MRYIIDACNLIFQDETLSDLLEERGFPAVRAAVLRLLLRYAWQAGAEEVIAVFDGSEKAAHRSRSERSGDGKVLLLFADPRADADRAILELVRRAEAPGGFTVVTSDKSLGEGVRRAGARHLTCAQFLRGLRALERRAQDPLRGEDPRKFKGTPAREVEQWMRIFGIDEDGELEP